MTYQGCLKQSNPNNKAKNISYPLSPNQAITIGREPDCQIVLDSKTYQGVSRRHAQIRPLATVSSSGKRVWELCDLESSNGTYLNDTRIYGCYKLEPGDKIRFGQTGPEFIFQLEELTQTPMNNPQKPWSYVVKNWRKSLYFGFWGAVGSLIGGAVFVPFGGGWKLCADTVLQAVVITALENAVIGGCMTVALLVAFSLYLRQGFKWQSAIKKGFWVGFLVGGIAGAIADIIYIKLFPSYFTQALSWSIAGGLIGFGLSFRIPNLRKQLGLAGGLIGGLLGGVLFVRLGRPNVDCFYGNSIASDVTSAVTGFLIGVAMLGFLIGLMIVIVEVVFRKAWLEVSYMHNKTRTITLGGEGTKFGSDPNQCNVCIEMVPPVAFHYTFHKGQIILEDVNSGVKTTVYPGDRRQLGSVTITVCGNPQIESA